MSKQVEAIHALRVMNAEELDQHLSEQRRRLFEVRFQQTAGQVENHRQIREIRREIARTMTVQIELVRGHHLVSDAELEAVERTEERPAEARRRRLSFRRAAASESAEPGELVAAEPVEENEPEGLEMAGDVEAAPQDAAAPEAGYLPAEVDELAEEAEDVGEVESAPPAELDVDEAEPEPGEESDR